jgi:diaminopimelate epimerase
MRLIKTHALGNDFLLARTVDVAPGTDRAQLAHAVCDRHRGIGADGLILYTPTALGASMDLLNADGSYSEVSGNGVRCLGAWLAYSQPDEKGGIEVTTDAGIKRLTLLARRGNHFTFRALMGQPTAIERVTLDAAGERVEAVTLRVGNPQCVVLGEATEERLHTIAAALAVHPHFPDGTNVELADVEAPERVRILIWERGVGPTQASGTGACAAAVASHRFGGAAADVLIVSPGGTQHVEWTEDGLYLTGPAEVVADVTWLEQVLT